MKLGVVKKISISMSLIIMLFFIIQIIIQNSYIDIIYDESKTAKLLNDLKTLMNHCSKDASVKSDFSYQSFSYSRKYDAPILIVSEDYKIVNQDFFNEFNQISVDLGNGKTGSILTDFINQFGEVPLSDFRYGKSIAFQGVMIGDSDFILPINMFYDNYSYSNSNLDLGFSSSLDTPNILEGEGYIKKVRIVNRDYYEFNRKSYILYDLLEKLLVNKAGLETYQQQAQQYPVYENWNGNKLILLSGRQWINDQYYYFFTLHEIESLDNIFVVLNPYYMAMYGIFLGLIIIISYFYSRWISKPLLQLNETAKSIAALDFSKSALAKSKDELGELAESLNEMSANLEKTIVALTKSNNQLADEAIKRSESEHRIRYLLTNLSHEFKTPLSIISGFLDVLRDGLCEKDPDYYYHVMSEEIQNLNGLITETIELSKLQSGFYNLEFKRFHLEEYLEKVISAFSYQLKGKDLSLLADIQGFEVYGDPVRIEQVLINLFSNAVKYSEQKGYIRVITVDKGEEVMVSIENKGRIDRFEIEKIWNRFYTSKDPEISTLDSSGIGLEIVKNILELHNSKYGVETGEGVVRFYFTLDKANKKGQDLIRS